MLNNDLLLSIGNTGVTLTGYVSYAEEQTLTETEQLQALSNLGIIEALTELITEYGGTVSASLSAESLSAGNTDSDDPWAELEA